MAVFVVKGYKGAGVVPQSCPPAVNPFTDFTCSDPLYAAAAPFIIQLYNDGVTGGCSTNPLKFCPGDTIGEWESLVWLARGGTPNNPFWPTYHPVPRGSTYTLRDEGNRVATEIAGGLTGSSTATLSVARDNVFLGSLLVASNAAGAWTYSASDHLGSIRAIWNATGTKVEDHRYWPYGEDAFAALNQHLSFQGMERNDATAQYFDHARTHQFNLGRFVSPDILTGDPETPQSWNRYTYALDNPTRYFDPDGKATLDLIFRVAHGDPQVIPVAQGIAFGANPDLERAVAGGGVIALTVPVAMAAPEGMAAAAGFNYLSGVVVGAVSNPSEPLEGGAVGGALTSVLSVAGGPGMNIPRAAIASAASQQIVSGKIDPVKVAATTTAAAAANAQVAVATEMGAKPLIQTLIQRVNTALVSFFYKKPPAPPPPPPPCKAGSNVCNTGK